MSRAGFGILSVAGVVAAQQMQGQAAAGVAVEISAEIVAAVKTGNDRFLAALIKGDAAAFGAVFAEDGIELPAGGPIVRGRAAIIREQAAAGEGRLTGGEIVTIEMHRSGDIVYEIGRYRFDVVAGEKKEVRSVTGRYLTLWKRTSEGWRIAVDCGQPGAPPA